ncbi:AsmA family protein [Ottowia sp. VDI28]|uniref:AsmA family protein n=1 Tax=Ottowia sp. VDI28 TaxID=3133968 RepID=UPI003C2D5BE5
MTKSRIFRITLRVVWALALTLVLLVAGALAFVYLYDWNKSRPWVNQQVSQALGRDFAVQGDLAVHWQWPQPAEPGWQRWIPGPLVQAHDVFIGNPAGFAAGLAPGQEEKFARIGQAGIRLALPPLLWRHFDIRSVALSEPDVQLIRKLDGSSNWTFELPESSAGGESRWRVSLGRLSVDHGLLAYDDAKTKLAVRAQLASLRPADTEDGRYGIGFTLSGRYGKAEVKGEGKAGPLLSLRDERIDYPLKFDAHAGRLGATAEGIIENPRALSGLDLRVSVKGDSMAQLYGLTGLVLPDTPPFQTRGRLVGSLKPNGAVWSYNDFTGSVGQSDLRGQLTYTSAQPRPRLTGKMSSRQLRLADLGPTIGVGSSTPEKKARPGKVLPDDPFATERWDKMDLDIDYAAQRVLRPEAVPIDSLRVHARLENAQLKLAPLDFGVAKGRFKTQVELDAKAKPLRVSVRGEVRDLSLSSLFPKVELMKKSLGRMDGGVALNGQGPSIAKILASANGEAKLYVRDGVMSKQLLDLAGLNLGSVVLSKLFGSDKEVSLRCAIADVPVRSGVAYARNVKINTEDALIDITGTVDMANEMADLDVNPKAYKLKFFSLRTPLEVRGPFANAHVGVKPGPLLLRAAAVAAAAAAAPAALALVPITVPGAEDDAACAPLLATAAKPPKVGRTGSAPTEEPAARSSAKRAEPSPQPAAGEFSSGSPKR